MILIQLMLTILVSTEYLAFWKKRHIIKTTQVDCAIRKRVREFWSFFIFLGRKKTV